MTPRATILVLSHRPQFVGGALASALAQTVPVQVVVNFDADAYVTKVNDGMKAARAEWVAILCDDDLLHPTFVERMLQCADDADVIYCDRRVFHDGDDPATGNDHIYCLGAPRDVKGWKQTIDPQSFAFGSVLPMTCLIRRSVWEKVGGYDGTILHSDTEFFYRAVRSGARVVYAPAVLWSYRLHNGQMSHVLNSTPDALAGFHRKHFADFGHAYHLKRVAGDEWTVPVIRAGFWRWLHRAKLALRFA